MVEVDCAKAWRNELNIDSLTLGYSTAQAISLAQDAELNGFYHDVHCWVFTPQSFCNLCLELAKAELLAFECEKIIPTVKNEFGFFAWLKPSGDQTKIVESWETICESQLS